MTKILIFFDMLGQILLMLVFLSTKWLESKGDEMPAHNASLIGKVANDMKFVFNQPQPNKSIRFNFMGFNFQSSKPIITELRSESNELRIRDCRVRFVFAWYTNVDSNIKSHPSVHMLLQNTIELHKPENPIQEIVGQMVHLTKFQVKNWTNKLTYYYVAHLAEQEKEWRENLGEEYYYDYDENEEYGDGFHADHMDDDIANNLFEVHDKDIIKVDCMVDTVYVFARDECNRPSLVKQVKIIRDRLICDGFN